MKPIYIISYPLGWIGELFYGIGWLCKKIADSLEDNF